MKRMMALVIALLSVQLQSPAPVAAGALTPITPLPAGVGPIVVVEQNAGRVILVSPNGEVEVLLEGVSNPRGIALSPDGQTIAVVVAGTAPGEGSIVLVSPGEEPRRIIEGLDFLEGVAFLDDETLVFTGFTEQVITVVGTDGGDPRSTEIAANPTGVVRVEQPGRTGMAVATWDQPAVLFDPATGQVTPITPPLAGGGHPALDPTLGLCVPELLLDRVSCFPVAGGDPVVFGRIDQPVGAAITGHGLLLVSGPEGISVIDPSTGERLTVLEPFTNPAGLVVLGDDGEDWLTVGPVPGTTTTTSAGTTTTSTTTTTVPAVPPASGTDDEDGIPWWPILAGFAAVVLAIAWIVRRRGSSFAVYPDPCDEICRAAEEARRAAEEAEREAGEAEQAAERARADAGDADQRRTDAENKADKAKQAADAAARAHQQAQHRPAHRGGYAASGGVEYTGADHDRVEAKRQAIDKEVEAGTKSQKDAQAEKAELRDPDKWKELEEREVREHAERVEAARQKEKQAREDAADAEHQDDAARDDAKSARQRAENAERQAREARTRAEEAARDAEAKEKACRECLGQAAIAAAGGPASWITQQGGVGGPCPEDEKKTVTKTDTLFVLDESREVVIEDLAMRPDRIGEETRSGISNFLGWVGGVLGVGSKVPGTGLPAPGRLVLSYVGLMSMAASRVIGALGGIAETAGRPGGMSDYYFVQVTVPRTKVTVTCTCTIECRHGVMTCTGCTVRESSEPGDSVERSEGTRAEVERLIASMQARARTAKEAQTARAAAVDGCSC